MHEQNFSSIVAANYTEICRNFKAGVKHYGYTFDEDIMGDAFLSCCNTLKDKQLTKQEAIKYYWTAYINKYKTRQEREFIMDCYDNMEEEFDDIETKYYNSTTDKIYDIIIAGVQDHFGVRKATIWEMYACQGKSSKEIRAMGFDDIDNYAYFTKQVKRYIKNHIIAENRELQELIAERKEY
jgi:hypothetical protein